MMYTIIEDKNEKIENGITKLKLLEEMVLISNTERSQVFSSIIQDYLNGRIFGYKFMIKE